MNFFFKLIIILAILILNACSKNDKEISLIKEINQEDEMIQAYKEGVKALEENDTFFAAKKFLEAELLFPQSDWAPKSSLMASYAYYIEGNYFNAIYNLERFLKTYPKDPRLDYVYYLMGLSYYENIEGEKKDLKPLLEAKKKFEFIIENYPNTDFALDSKFKIGLILGLSLTFTTLTFGQYNECAGQNKIVEKRKVEVIDDNTGETTIQVVEQEVAKDTYGNPDGNQYDLAVDGAFEGQTVAVLPVSYTHLTLPTICSV